MKEFILLCSLLISLIPKSYSQDQSLKSCIKEQLELRLINESRMTLQSFSFEPNTFLGVNLTSSYNSSFVISKIWGGHGAGGIGGWEHLFYQCQEVILNQETKLVYFTQCTTTRGAEYPRSKKFSFSISGCL